MAQSLVGEVVVVRFPFSNLSGQKRRPALVIAAAEFENYILCQITSKRYTSQRAIALEADDFLAGALPVASFIRPDKLFTADVNLIEKRVGQLKKRKLATVLLEVRNLFKGS